MINFFTKIIFNFQSWMSFPEGGEEEDKEANKNRDDGTQSSSSDDDELGIITYHLIKLISEPNVRDVTMFDESLPGPSTSNQSDLRQHIETISRQMMAQMEELRGKSF